MKHSARALSALFVLLVMLGYAVLLMVAEEETTVPASDLSHDESGPSETDESIPKDPEEPKPKRDRRKKADDFDVKNENWGTYYDPQGIFCGQFDCYKILGFDYESYDKIKPTTKEITQRYRRLSREWHPDKSKHKNAKERFVKIARAYEVLTSVQVRKEYDDLRYNQQAYFSKYGTSVVWKVPPKTDVFFALLLVLVIANVVSWYAQKHRWNLVADRLIKAAVEDWAPKDGGTPESKQLREEALEILAKRERENNETSEAESVVENETAVTPTSGVPPKSTKKKVPASKSAKKDIKLTTKEKKKLEQEALLPIITDLVNEMEDFGGGFHKPTWKDLVIVKLAQTPIDLGEAIVWQAMYTIRRIQKKELSDDEKGVLTSRAVGPVIWNTATEEDRAEMITKTLWKKENLIEWKEEQEFKKLSITEQKTYMRMKKKGKVE